MIEVNAKDIIERTPGQRGRVNLSKSEEVKRAAKEGKKVEVAVLGVVEEDE